MKIVLDKANIKPAATKVGTTALAAVGIIGFTAAGLVKVDAASGLDLGKSAFNEGMVMANATRDAAATKVEAAKAEMPVSPSVA